MLEKTKKWIAGHKPEIKATAVVTVTAIGVVCVIHTIGWVKGYNSAVNQMIAYCQSGLDYVVDDTDNGIRYILKFAKETLNKN